MIPSSMRLLNSFHIQTSYTDAAAARFRTGEVQTIIIIMDFVRCNNNYYCAYRPGV